MTRFVYTDEHIEYLRKISLGRSNREITRMFNEKFSMNQTENAIQTIRTRRGIKANNHGKPQVYKDFHIEYLKEISPNRTNAEITKLFNERFNFNKSIRAIQATKNRYGIRSFDIPAPYTEEQIEYIRSIAKDRANSEITEKFNKKYGENRTEVGIASIRHKHRIVTGTDGRFQRGEIAPNWVPVGTERVTVDGYPEVKVKDGCGQDNWRGRHIVKWEELNGPLPDGHAIMFGDGDKANLNIDNLICVSRKQLLGLNRHDLIQDDANLTKTAINIVDLNYKISEVIDK